MGWAWGQSVGVPLDVLCYLPVKWLVFCLESRATTSFPLDCTRETLTDTLKLSFLSIYVSRMSGSLLHVNLGSFRILPCPAYVLSWLVAKLLLPGKSHGQRSPVGYSPWGCNKNICAVLCLVTQSCSPLCDPMDCLMPGSSVHERQALSRAPRTGNSFPEI